jgi:hypothetical protein
MYPVNRSTANKIALFPLAVFGIFGIKSIAQVVPGE